MSFFGELTPKAMDAVKNVRDKSKKESLKDFYVDSGRELEVDDAVVRLEEHAVKAREFLAVNHVIAIAANDDDSSDDATADNDIPTKVVNIRSKEKLSGPASKTIKDEMAAQNPDPEKIARALVEEAHTYTAEEEVRIETVSDGATIVEVNRYLREEDSDD